MAISLLYNLVIANKQQLPHAIVLSAHIQRYLQLNAVVFEKFWLYPQ